MHNTDISVKSTDIGGLVIWVGEEEIQLLGRSVWGSERNDQVFCMILGDFSKIQANDIINIVWYYIQYELTHLYVFFLNALN